MNGLNTVFSQKAFGSSNLVGKCEATLSKIYSYSVFLILKNYSMWIEGQSEHLEFCSDIRALLFSFLNKTARIRAKP